MLGISFPFIHPIHPPSYYMPCCMLGAAITVLNKIQTLPVLIGHSESGGRPGHTTRGWKLLWEKSRGQRCQTASGNPESQRQLISASLCISPLSFFPSLSHLPILFILFYLFNYFYRSRCFIMDIFPWQYIMMYLFKNMCIILFFWWQ